MKRFSIFALAAVAMFFVGCTKDIDTDITKEENIIRGELVKKTLIIEDTRVERDEASGKLTWSQGDQFKVVLLNDGTYTLDTNVYTVDHTTGTVEIPSNAVYVIYPSSIATAVEASTAKVDLNFTQFYTINTTPDAIFDWAAMKGTVDGDFVTFKNLMGYLKIPLTGNGTLNKLSVKSEIFNGFKPLSRKFKYDLTKENADFELLSSHNEAVAWVGAKFPKGLDLSTSPAVYLPVPANTYNDLVVIAETDNGATTIYANNSHTVSRSKIKPVASKAINVSEHTPSNPTLLSGTSGDPKMDYANTYIVPPTAGEYAFEAALSDGTSLAGGITAEIVWAEEAGMFYDFHYSPSDNVISFKTNGKEGNALIALSKNDAGTKCVIWSWLLWCTDAPETISIVGDNNATYKVMDRVIGATWHPTTLLTDQRAEKGWTEAYMMNASISSKDATDGCGLYYQYQNMIPYPRIKDIDATANESNPDGKSGHNLTNTRVAVQYGFHMYCQYWVSSAACATVSVDDNGQYRTAASYNLSYEYYAASNNAWCFTPLKGGTGKAEKTDSYARLWGGTSAPASPKDYKSTHDPCPAGYIIDNYSGLYHYLGANSPATKAGYVRNPQDNSEQLSGYKFYGMWLSGCTNSNGQAADLYTPCCSARTQTVCRTIGSYANMGYLYTYNTNGDGTTTFEYVQGGTTYTGYKASNNQFGESVNGKAIGSPWGGSSKKITNGQGYPVRCRKFGN